MKWNEIRRAMLLSLATNDRGEERILVLPLGSVVSYFTAAEDGEGLALHVERGVAAYPEEFERNRDGVRRAVLDEVARRLDVPEQDVLCQTIRRLKTITDPSPLTDNPWASPRRARGRFKGFVR